MIVPAIEDCIRRFRGGKDHDRLREKRHTEARDMANPQQPNERSSGQMLLLESTRVIAKQIVEIHAKRRRI